MELKLMVKTFSIIAGYMTDRGFIPLHEYVPTTIHAADAKAALRKYRRHHAISTGVYEIFKSDSIWVLSSSYGVDFIAI